MIDIEVIESWDKGGRETLVREKKTRIKFEVRRKGRKKRERENGQEWEVKHISRKEKVSRRGAWATTPIKKCGHVA